MEKLVKLKAAHQVAVDEMETILAAAEGALTEEQQKSFDTAKGKAESIKVQIANHEQLITAKAEANRIADKPAAALGRQVGSDEVIISDATTVTGVADSPLTVPASARRWAGNLVSFTGENAALEAYKAAMFFAATLCGHDGAKAFCGKHGIATSMTAFQQTQIQALQQEGINSLGGFLVFDELDTAIIRLVEEYGLVRRKMRNTPMMGDTKNRPRRTGGATAYFVGEGDQITGSTATWDNVKLIAKKLAAIVTSSNELISDAFIKVADELVREIALAFATKEDVCGFQGDGTSTFGGIVGFVPLLSSINGVDDGGGLVLATGNLWSEIVDVDLTTMIGRVPNYAGIDPEWYCSKAFWSEVMVRLERAAGGNTVFEISSVKPRPIYAGYPVNWTSGVTAMPVAEANSQICALFADMRMSAMFGDRKGMTIATSTDAVVGDTSMFDTDSFAVRGIERFDINVHDVGTASAAGPSVGLITQSS